MIADNLKRIKAEIAEACVRAGRAPESVKLIAVSKTKPASDVLKAYEAGQRVFGENYVQELLAKFADATLQNLPIEWHFVGHLQSNKARYLAEKIAMIHGVDKLSLAEEISKRAKQRNRSIPILLEVNISNEVTKHGLKPDALFAEAEKIFPLPNIELKGLMTIASPDREKVKSEFKEMRRLFEKLKSLAPKPDQITELSMGMSGDFDIAIEEGATLLRLGTAIFGERSK
ncbi:MAG: YggS family pyridoxal phosphate-dependent enzyme [Chloroherpetonaceae bacterium]|nr:YggS family pyridoxal phosphate-dependent enzyme [Chloroherpetonaceae bacterium]MDW8436678.1 YggS family pyridoxal phosphate-dependent enzyme [Chloroherpetonaceae bacterium]